MPPLLNELKNFISASYVQVRNATTNQEWGYLTLYFFVCIIFLSTVCFGVIGEYHAAFPGPQKTQICTTTQSVSNVSARDVSGIIQTGANSTATQTVYPPATFNYSIISKSKKQSDALYATGFVWNIVHAPQETIGIVQTSVFTQSQCRVTPPGPGEANSGKDSLDALTGLVTTMRKFTCLSNSPIVDSGDLFTYTAK